MCTGRGLKREVERSTKLQGATSLGEALTSFAHLQRKVVRQIVRVG